jgi:RNA polymerase sigma factor (TIGR02999 family)
MGNEDEINRLLQNMDGSDPRAADQLLNLLYSELRKLAAAKLAREAPGQTLQATALVHEAWLRVNGGDDKKQWDGRGHFFASAAEAMRRILIDNARRKRALRHGGGLRRVEMEGLEIAGTVQDDELLEVNEALNEFAQQDPRKAELVKLRYFAGLTLEEVADVMDISVPTAKRWWNYSRACLRTRISSQ